jgi:2-desacetyl-2-hydroxyethyl bacteriochlorophyllide A dehydrogenase
METAPMPLIVRFTAPHQVDLHSYTDRRLSASEVRVRTLFSGISAGTELTAYRGSNPYLDKRWDEDGRLFIPDTVSLQYPIEGWGYEEVGEVVELGADVESVSPGDIVWGTWGHRSSAVLSADYAAGRTLPAGVDPVIGAFAHIGAIALNAVLDADIHLGETVAVFGQGTPGLIAGQLARLNGGTVVAVDALEGRLRLAQKLGAAHAFNALESPSPAQRIKELTGGRGADVSIEISGHYGALHEAIRATAWSSRVVASGFFQGPGTALALGEEFHHNRISVVGSQISGVSPALSHRWDIHRLQATVMDLAVQGRIDLPALVSHVMPADAAAEAFSMLDLHPEQAVQVLLDFREL